MSEMKQPDEITPFPVPFDDQPDIVIDTRPRCGQMHPDQVLWCDEHAGHEGDHAAHYGWTGRAEVWS